MLNIAVTVEPAMLEPAGPCVRDWCIPGPDRNRCLAEGELTLLPASSAAWLSHPACSLQSSIQHWGRDGEEGRIMVLPSSCQVLSHIPAPWSPGMCFLGPCCLNPWEAEA